MKGGMPVEWDALVAGLEFDGQSSLSERLTEVQKSVLGREDVGVAQPADETAILDPRSAGDHGFLTAQTLESIDHSAQGLASGRERGRAVDQILWRPRHHHANAERDIILLLGRQQ